jgi:SAM-dependent methyltransferase
MHLNSKLLFESHAKPLFRDGMRVLEIGPDSFPSSYQKIVGNGRLVWETIDLYNLSDLNYKSINEYEFPIQSNTFDVVLSGQVIEHVRKIWVWMKEVARVCKPGGLVITINPVSWKYHLAPVDCWRIYPDGMRALYDDAGLEMKKSVFESLEPWSASPYYMMKQAIKRLIGRKPWPELAHLVGPVVDTISIGVKR